MIALRCAIAAQAVGDQAARLVLQTTKQLLETCSEKPRKIKQPGASSVSTEIDTAGAYALPASEYHADPVITPALLLVLSALVPWPSTPVRAVRWSTDFQDAECDRRSVHVMEASRRRWNRFAHAGSAA